MSPKPLIVMALESEGQGRLEKLGYEVLYCGVGKVNACYYLTRRLVSGPKVPYVLNIGSAGSSSFKAHELVAADRFVQRDMDASGIGFAKGETPFEKDPPITISFKPYFTHLPHGICGSGDSFLQGPTPVESNIFDMEAYALAKVCKLEGVDFVSVKYITDGADADAAGHWEEHLKHAAQAFCDLLIKA